MIGPSTVKYEEYMLCDHKRGNILILWQNDNIIVVGQNQITAAEINRSYVENTISMW